MQRNDLFKSQSASQNRETAPILQNMSHRFVAEEQVNLSPIVYQIKIRGIISQFTQGSDSQNSKKGF